MTGPELKTIRHRLGLSTLQLGRAFGYTGSDTTASVTIRKYESGGRPIPPWLGRLAIMFDEHGVPPEFLDTRRIELESIRTEIAAATSVVALCSLLNSFERLRKDMADDCIDAEEIEIPQLFDYHRDDWHEFSDNPMGADAENVLFREPTGRFYYQSRSEIEEDDPPVTEY
jgi:transcriptional regulator with XRE-family HTH domain